MTTSRRYEYEGTAQQGRVFGALVGWNVKINPIPSSLASTDLTTGTVAHLPPHYMRRPPPCCSVVGVVLVYVMQSRSQGKSTF